MKKLLYVLAAALCLVACEKNTENGSGSTVKGDYVDLGLKSGTKWKTQNEQSTYDYYDLFDYETAISEFGNNLPTEKQWKELISYCHWEWTGNGYKITGSNGKSISLPATSYRDCDGNVSSNEGSDGCYWSSKQDDSDWAWNLFFDSDEVYMDSSRRCVGLSVRLVSK